MTAAGLGLLSGRCGACGRTGPSPCLGCRPKLLPAPPLVAPAPLATLAALLVYEGPAIRLVLGIKARHERSAVGWLADGLALLLPPDVDLVTWAPTTRRRAASRGVDQARLLAEAVARRAGVRSHVTVTRCGDVVQQGRSRVDRTTHGPTFAPRFALEGRRVAVIDDVTTTGATLAGAGRALVVGGADVVHGVAVAAAPSDRLVPKAHFLSD
jgi:predicted amidophosphoribosyltransferase